MQAGSASKTFAVIGGDSRQARMCALLCQSGHRVRAFALDRCALPAQAQRSESVRDACQKADCVILPMPLSRDSGMLNAPLSSQAAALSEVFSEMEPGTLVCAGAVTEEAERLAQKQQLRLFDYLRREELAVANAVPTAEGAIQIAMEELPITISGSRCLVIGCGRIGKALSARLRALGAAVSVSARKARDLAYIRAMGNTALHTAALEPEMAEFDVIFNTVPASVLEKPQLRRVRPDALVIDLASLPGGVDMEGAGELGVRVIRALSLPGKVAPLSSARIVLDTVYNIMEEEMK